MKLCIKAVVLVLSLVWVAYAQGSPASYQGQVVDKDGKAVSKATVRAFAIIGDQPLRLVGLGTMTTGDDGKFALNRASAGALAAVVIAEKDGYSLGLLKIGRNEIGRGTIRLGEPVVTGGEVVDQDGKGIAGAKICPTLSTFNQGSLSNLPDADVLAAVTDDKGRFEFKNLPVGSRAAFIVTAAGRAMLASQDEFPAGRKDIKLSMLPEAKIQGVLKGADGTVLSDTIIVAMSESGYIASRATTNKQGEFVLGSLAPGKYTCRTISQSKAAKWIVYDQAVTVATDGITTVAFDTVKAGALSIEVKDAETGQPVPGAAVTLTTQKANEFVMAFADDKGEVTANLAPGTYNVVVQCEGYETIFPGAQPATNVEEGHAAKTEIKLKPWPTLKGTVKDAQGQGVGNVYLSSLNTGPLAMTDENGQFAMRFSPRRSLIAKDTTGLAGIVDVPNATKEVVITLSKGLVVKGVVIDMAKNAIKGAAVSVYAGKDGCIGRALSGLNGEYELGGLPQKTDLIIIAVADGYGRAKAGTTAASFKDSVAVMEPLVLLQANMELSGTVKDQQGHAIAGVTVSVTGEGQPKLPATVTDGAGRFAFKGLGKGRVQLFATKGDQGSTGLADVGQTDATVVMTQGAGDPPRLPSPSTGSIGKSASQP